MSDDLLRRFREKIRNRAGARGRDDPAGAPGGVDPAEHAAPAGATGPASDLEILDATVGRFAEADRLHPLFVPGLARVRVTLGIGPGLRRRAKGLSVRQVTRLLEICPELSRHSCGAGNPVQALLRPSAPPAGGADSSPVAQPGSPGGTAAAAAGTQPEDGVTIAHLIEHVAIDMTVRAAGGGRCSGVTCAWRDRLDRFDLFLEATDPALARTAMLLAAALVRDLCLGRTALDDYRRVGDLLATLTNRGRRDTTPEDVCDALGWGMEESLATLRTLVRCGYLEAVVAPFTFSSPAGVIYRPVPPAGRP
jgi:hypothetical protein